MRKNKQYEAIAAAILDVRRRAALTFEPGTVPAAVADTICDQVAEAVGRALKGQHRSDLPWRQSRWDEATGTESRS